MPSEDYGPVKKPALSLAIFAIACATQAWTSERSLQVVSQRRSQGEPAGAGQTALNPLQQQVAAFAWYAIQLIDEHKTDTFLAHTTSAFTKARFLHYVAGHRDTLGIMESRKLLSILRGTSNRFEAKFLTKLANEPSPMLETLSFRQERNREWKIMSYRIHS